jgi:hypothetical protein
MTKASEQMREFLSVAQDGPNYVSAGHIDNCRELLAENERLIKEVKELDLKLATVDYANYSLRDENERFGKTRITYIKAIGSERMEMRKNAINSELYQKGDMALIWVNKGELINHDMVHDLLKGVA